MEEVSYIIIESGIGHFRVAERTCYVRLDKSVHQQGKSYIDSVREYIPWRRPSGSDAHNPHPSSRQARFCLCPMSPRTPFSGPLGLRWNSHSSAQASVSQLRLRKEGVALYGQINKSSSSRRIWTRRPPGRPPCRTCSRLQALQGVRCASLGRECLRSWCSGNRATGGDDRPSV